jgi:hypothetical protein
LDIPNSSSTLHVPCGNRYLGILPGESYIGICVLADLFLFAFKIPNTAKAIIYIDDAKICFTIKGKKERFTFKNKTLQSPAHPQKTYIYEDKIAEKKTNRRNKTKQSPTELVNMINTVHTEYDHLLISLYLLKQDDSGVTTIE